MVGKFSHGYPNMQTIRTYFAKLGFRGAYSVGVINIKHILIKLSNEEDLSRLWLKQILFIKGFPMRLFKWSPYFNPKVESDRLSKLSKLIIDSKTVVVVNQVEFLGNYK
ncbi:UNVERIFIED_CONTAM: hypothetical protein Slati_2132000 [Sesamum latifolium]|uniref:DUF4283 domain-containing protein n=1 Tax=Sesamum latifolium TaxID=2727402 RepID=A0AAW2WRR4_9LAMI